MAEYIEREALMEKFSARSPLLMQIRAYIAAEPAADVAPVVHGRWTTTDTMLGRCCICSVCGSCPTMEYRFCPYCGARMDLEV